MNAAALTSEIQPLIAQPAEPVRAGIDALIAKLTRHIGGQEKHIGGQEKRIAILEEQRRLDALARFASKAGRIRDLNPNQLELPALEPGLNEAEREAVLAETPAQQQAEAPAIEAQVKAKRYKRKAHPGREPLPAHLRREDILIDEPPAALPGSLPPQELRRDTTERPAVVPAEYCVERITTVSYIFPGQPDKGVHRGAGPAARLPKSIPGPPVAIDFVIAKYAGHQPVYRLVMALSRESGIELSYPTADRAVIDTAAPAIPLADARWSELIAGDYIQADGPTKGRPAA